VSLQEQMIGRLGPVNRARKAEELLRAYGSLIRTLEGFRRLHVLPYDEAAHTHFQELRPQLRRLGALDLRIACIALAHNATELTRTLRDSGQVPGLAAEDWSR